MSIAPLGISWFIMQGRTEAILICAVYHLISNFFCTLKDLSTCPFSNSNKFNYYSRITELAIGQLSQKIT
jgi:hypothetical protein